jgi:predicted metalloendopeptidase
MGHELTHGFDDQGRLYNGDGKLDNWWENATSQKFDEKVDSIIKILYSLSKYYTLYLNTIKLLLI